MNRSAHTIHSRSQTFLIKAFVPIRLVPRVSSLHWGCYSTVFRAIFSMPLWASNPAWDLAFGGVDWPLSKQSLILEASFGCKIKWSHLIWMMCSTSFIFIVVSRFLPFFSDNREGAERWKIYQSPAQSASMPKSARASKMSSFLQGLLCFAGKWHGKLSCETTMRATDRPPGGHRGQCKEITYIMADSWSPPETSHFTWSNQCG